MTWSRRALPVFMAILAVCVIAPEHLAWAHPIPPASIQLSPVLPEADLSSLTLKAANPDLGIPWWAFLVAAASLGLGLSRPRRVLSFALVVLLALLVYQTGLHSVHHFTDSPNSQTHCAVASAAAHVLGANADSPSSDAPRITASGWVVPSQVDAADPLPVPKPQGRAPPVLA